jgi:hypothetical protein
MVICWHCKKDTASVLFWPLYSIVIINFGSQWMFVMNVNSSCIKQTEKASYMYAVRTYF